jgi:hypothetical protein
MRGAIHSLPQYAFVAWCSVKNKAQGQVYLYFARKYGGYKEYEPFLVCI